MTEKIDYEQKVKGARVWINTPKGKKKFESYVNAAMAFTKKLQENRKVSWQTMQEEITL